MSLITEAKLFEGTVAVGLVVELETAVAVGLVVELETAVVEVVVVVGKTASSSLSPLLIVPPDGKLNTLEVSLYLTSEPCHPATFPSLVC